MGKVTVNVLHEAEGWTTEIKNIDIYSSHAQYKIVEENDSGTPHHSLLILRGGL